MKENTTFSKESDNIFAQIILEQAHIEFINEQIDNIYDKVGELTEYEDASLNFLFNEKDETQNRLRELKMEYTNALKEESATCTGKIEIEYKDIPDEVRWELYHILNKYVMTVPGFSYHTVENTKYSKDFKYE